MHQTNSRNGHARNAADFPPEIRAQAESVSPDFYALFGYPETLGIDLDDLQEAFYAVRRRGPWKGTSEGRGTHPAAGSLNVSP